MIDKFKDRFRVPSNRLYQWDYKWSAIYFITICTEDRTPYFGEVVNQKMRLSDIGDIAEAEWKRTFAMRQDMNLNMGEYVIMPNHFHAIVGIGRNEYNAPSEINQEEQEEDEPKNHFGPQSKNLASLIRGFKVSVTINARKQHPEFKWHSLFYDHIIRNASEYINIERYIINNPSRWKEDKFNE